MRPEGSGAGDQKRVVTPRQALEDGASMLVIGLRRRTSVGKFLMGSSASMILMQSPCPVLAVKAPGGEHRVSR